MATHDIRYPNETDEYRIKRNELLDAEMELRAKIEAVAALRRGLPLGGLVEDYVFDGVGGSVRLSELFEEGKQSLILYGYMYGPDDEAPCPMCSSFLDGANAYYPHLSQRVNFAIVARSPIERLCAVAEERGWSRLPLLSSANNDYAIDYVTQAPDGSQLPKCHVFVKREDGVHHFWASELLFAPWDQHPRHIDMLWPIWHYFDLTPEGRENWMPALDY